MDSVVTILQIVRFSMLGSIALYAFVALRLASNVTPQPLIFRAITLLAVIMVVLLFVARRILISRSEITLAQASGDTKALMQWRAGHLLTYCFSEAIAIYGLVLHFLGFSLSEVAPFFLAGAILILFFAPHRPGNAMA